MNDSDSYNDWCQHYASMAGVEGFRGRGTWEDSHCAAGIRHGDVKQDRIGARNHLDRMPCFRRNGLSCPAQRFNTTEEAEAKRQADMESIRQSLHELATGICPNCKATVEREVQVGRCVYAEPCGHRLFQGRAKSIVPCNPEARAMLEGIDPR